MKVFWILLLTSLAWPSWAHQSSDSFVYVNTATGEGRLDIAVSDLQRVFNLDDNEDTKITWQELSDKQAAIDRYVHARLALGSQETACTLTWQPVALTLHASGNYLALPFRAQCPSNSAWKIHYGILFDRDALHRALVRWNSHDSSGLTILTPTAPDFEIAEAHSRWIIFTDYFRQGVLHLLVGYDHLLFLLALLLPVMSRLIRPNARFGPALRDTLGLVTLFTIAHSCTLAMSALGVVKLPTALVEVLIALSVSGAGVVALIPHWHRYRFGLSFGFGLIHGFGFANVLAELTSTVSEQVVSLAAFNLGVEAGQAFIISLTLPTLYALRQWLHKARWSLPGSAYGVILCGLFWAWQRL